MIAVAGDRTGRTFERPAGRSRDDRAAYGRLTSATAVTATTETAATTTAATAAGEHRQTARAVGWWLIGCCVIVVGMVLLGGYTRLTHSGLSMVEWQPSTLLPPTSESAWLAEFARYKQFPEYLKLNQGMTLAEFKSIYYPEFFHRILARLLGLALIAPFLWFLVRRSISPRMLRRIIGVGALAALQGVIGWLMVSSGLVDRPSVSHFRLALHLLAAFALYAWMLWLALEILLPADRTAGTSPQARAALRKPVIVVATLTVITATWGAFVAGLHAGLMYNTFPLMGDAPWPPSFGSGSVLDSLVDFPPAVQFVHRVLAITTFAFACWLVVRLRRSELPWRMRRTVMLVPLMVVVQFALGVTTLLLVVPVGFAMAHQAGALVLLSTALVALAQLHAPPVEARPRAE